MNYQPNNYYMNFLLRIRTIIFCFYLILFSGFQLYAQETKVTGKVTDILTNEPVPFAPIIFKGTSDGANTDMNGVFTMTTNGATDSIICNTVGYARVAMRVKRGQSQVINIVLKVGNQELKEVVIKAGENPANIIIRNIIHNRSINVPTSLDSYQYESYNKLEFDLTNITDKFKNNKLIKPFSFIFDKIDSSETNSKPFLPFFITESLSDVYYKNNPYGKREIVKGSKVSGMENTSITQFLGDMYQKINIYDNFIELFGKGFVSPIADVGLVYYKYYLLDSAYLDNQWCYKLKFRPRRPQELTFVGELWVQDTTWAIKKIDMRIATDANINFVEDMAIVQEFERVNNEHWMLDKDMLVIDFAARENGLGFIGRKTASYNKFKLNQTAPPGIFTGTEPIVVTDEASQQSDAFWQNSRHDSLSARELQIYHMVDTIKSLPAYKTYIDVITLFFTGYKNLGQWEFGPYYTVYSFNKVEGNRFRLGGRTSPEFSKRIRFEGYGAYGTTDQRFKYMGSVRYKIADKPLQYISASYKDDIRQLGLSDNAFQDDNILSSLFRRSPSTKLSMIEQQNISYDIEWFPGLSSNLTFLHSHFAPLGNLNISYYADDAKKDSSNAFTTSEVTLYSRFAYHEKFIKTKYGRVSMGSIYPVVQVSFTAGIKNILQSDFNYQKITLKVDDQITLNPFGYTYYMITAGKTFGRVPIPLLELHPGNESYFYDYAAFNMMNYFEFVSDYYLSAYATHHFDGFFFDKIPLIRKLKWREVVQVKSVWGRLTTKNQEGFTSTALAANTNLFKPLNKKPYVEVGAGVENIFKILRVDFLWRLSYLKNEPGVITTTETKIPQFGIRASLQITF